MNGAVTGAVLPSPEKSNSTTLNNKLIDLSRSLDGLSKSVELQLSSCNNDPAHTRTQSRQLLKRQLQSLKASLLNLGQKEHFLEVVKSFPEGHDFKPEADRAAAAVESAEEDLRDLKKINLQDEGQMHHAIQTIAGYHDQFKTVAARMSQKLLLSRKEMDNYDFSRPPQASPVQADVSEAELDAQLAAENARAVALESAIVAAQADRADLESALTANDAEIAALHAEVAALQAAKADVANQQKDRAHATLLWYQEVCSALSMLTGVSLAGIEHDSLRIILHHFTGTESRQVDCELLVHLFPGSSRVRAAALSPPDVDISEDVASAQAGADGPSSLQTLVAGVRQRLRAHLANV